MIFPIIPQFKQKLGLMCPADEIFLGGSLGGGKTLFDILQVMKWGLENNNLNIFIFRQTFEELKKSVIQEFIDTVPIQLFRYKSSERVGVLPNGSRIFFCYLENEKDLARYQSTNMEVLIIDECTHIPESFIVKLKKRNRSKRKGFRARTIFTGNPGGASHNYFYNRFMKNKNPYQIYVTEETKHLRKEQQVTQCFIPAGLVDNPALLTNDPAYIGKLLEMSDTDKEMYLYGNWEINTGQFFSEWNESIHVVDYDVSIGAYDTIVCGMDFGTAKPASIGFFHVKPDHSLLRYREIYTIRNNEPDVGTNENATQLAEKFVKSLSEVERDKIKYIVLDTACWQDQGHGRTIASIILDVFKEHHITIPIIQANKGRLAGWQQMRWYLGRMTEDGVPYLQIHKSCKNFIRTLPALVHGGTEGDLDCFVAGTKVDTLSGIKNIEDITIDDYMLTPLGYKKVIKDGISGIGDTLEVEFSNGEKLRGTPNHKIYVKGKGLVPIRELKTYDIIVSKEENHLWKKSFTEMLNIEKEKVESIITRGLTINTTHFITKFTKMCTEKYLLDMLFIIKTLMLITISWKTCKCLTIESIVNYIMRLEKNHYLKALKCGGTLKKVRGFLKIMQERCLKEHQKEDYRASYVEKSLCKQRLTKDSVAKSVRNQITILLQKIVKFVVKSLKLKETTKKKQEPVHIVAVGNLEKRTVYNLTVQGIRLYYANNVLVTNTRQEDHCFVKGTKIRTINGYKNIENINNNDLVLTREGYKNVSNYGLTIRNAKVSEYTINNNTITSTSNHPVLINNEFSPIDTVRYYDIIYTEDKNNEVYKWTKKTYKNLMGLNITEMGITTVATLLIIKKVLADYMLINTSSIKVVSKKDTTYTTLISTVTTMIYQILLRFQKKNIYSYTQEEIKKTKNILERIRKILVKLENLQKNGIKAKKEEHGIANMQKTLWLIYKMLLKFVSYVEKNTIQKKTVKIFQSFVQIIANLLQEEKVESIILTKYVSYVEKVMKSISIQNQRHAVPNVVVYLQVKQKGNQDVYNLSVNEKPEYFANNILVHNCADDCRYVCMMMPVPKNYKIRKSGEAEYGVPTTYKNC